MITTQATVLPIQDGGGRVQGAIFIAHECLALMAGDSVDGAIVRDHASRASSTAADAASAGTAAAAGAAISDTIIQSITCPITAMIL